MPAIAMTIAGSDSGGGAGIQADLKTFSALGVYGASAITAITAQNTLGVDAVENITPEMVRAQIRAVLSDLDVRGIKIGMVSRTATIEAVAATLDEFGRKAVLDPVMVATSGDRLLEPDAVLALQALLLPQALVVTPNLPEAALLAGAMHIAEDEKEMLHQAERILARGAGAVLVKGGHASGRESTDLFFDGEHVHRLPAPRIKTDNDHGTGCTLSAAIAANLALGLPLRVAVEAAKRYLHEALSAGQHMRIGNGHGPVHHFHAWWRTEKKAAGPADAPA
ncbi:MAG: bifunctional hydroxymethylpyrimidine kinase/phosphomethylpyrimidine kinase [Rhizobiaceae bacterium]|nr:bifunctional hydroxymethylpyrimidine kinase/phosphomethylpyrimidine kinase [Rhizobiaceae bacterium]MCV0408397.1 bifunctional hydroxymethylpyrimidine kinase/phosphomethylpyrimidine kinase [Rhizobiaceae bacterium]